MNIKYMVFEKGRLCLGFPTAEDAVAFIKRGNNDWQSSWTMQRVEDNNWKVETTQRTVLHF